jgi:hypothetical protein
VKLPALYQLTEQHRELERLADTTDDLPPEVIRDTIEALEGAIEAKAVSVAAVVRNLELHAEMIRTASKQLAERAARAEKRADSLRAYLLFNLQAVGVFKVESPEFTVTVRNNPVTVRIADERAVPAEFLVQPPAPPPKVDKAQIKEALKAGKDVPGCWLEAGQRVEIRS